MSSAERNSTQFTVRMTPCPATWSSFSRESVGDLGEPTGRKHPDDERDRGEQHAVEHLDDARAVGRAQYERDRAPDEAGEGDAGQTDAVRSAGEVSVDDGMRRV